MKHLLSILLVLSLVLFDLPSAKLSELPRDADADIKVALVLSGGGARGFADIPIIAALEEAGIPIDMVVGTSMGALIGGMYAAGYTPDQMASLVESYDMVEMFAVPPVSTRNPELSVFAEHKNNIISLEFDSEGIGRAPSLIGDQKILEMLNDSLINTSLITDFDDLSIPYRAIGTDLLTGEKIIFSEGSLVAAIRSSISIPGLFAPALIDGRAVIDGGVVDNLPIRVAKELGADIVIAVDVNSADYLRQAEDVTSLTQVIEQLVVIITRNTIVDQLDDAHLLFSVVLEGYGPLDFISFREIMEIGEQHAAEAHSEIETLRNFLEAAGVPMRDQREVRRYDSLPDIWIDHVSHTRLEPDESKPDVFPIEEFTCLEGASFDESMRALLRTELDQLRELNRYATVTYRIRNISCDGDGNPHGELDIVTREFPTRKLTLSLGLFGTTSIRHSLQGGYRFDFDPDISIELNVEEFLNKRLTFDLMILQREAVQIDASLRYRFSPSFSFGMSHEYKRGYLWGGDEVIPGTTDGQDFSYTASASGYATYRNSMEVKFTGSFDNLWYRQSDDSYTYAFVPSLSLGGVYTTQNFSLFPKEGTRVDFDVDISAMNFDFGYRFDFRGVRTWELIEDSYLSFRGFAGITRSVAHRRSDYFSYGGAREIATLSPSLRVKDRVLTSVSYVHAYRSPGIPLLFKAELSAGIRGLSTEDIYGTNPAVRIEPFELFRDASFDLMLSAGLGLQIQNADLLFGLAVDANLNAAVFVEVF